MSKTIYSDEYKYMVAHLKEVRKEAGLDPAAVAKVMGKTQSYISKIESGQRRIDVIQLRNL